MRDNYLTLKLFRFVWRKRFTPKGKVIKIKGWRTAIIDNGYGQRSTDVFLFSFEGPKRWRPKIWRWLPENYELPF